MKRLWIGFVVLSVIMVACLVYLIKSGVSVRPHFLIRPTVVKTNDDIARAVVHRLFAVFNESDGLVLGFKGNSQSRELLKSLVFHFEKSFPKKVNIFDSTKDCSAPCWLIVPSAATIETINPDFSFPEKFLENKKIVSLTVNSFQRDIEPSEMCLSQKVLSAECLWPVLVNNVKRKFRKDDVSYFFLAKYKFRDHYLMIETP